MLPLPRGLDPLTEESLSGYLLRLSHRLRLSPAELAYATMRRYGATTTSMLLALDAADAFASATRLTVKEVDQLTLAPLAPAYPALSLDYCGRTRTTAGVFIKENWVFSTATRYCPACLAGDGSPIQDEHGGAWQRTWRLPVVFGCTRHHSLLMATCPSCGRAVHAKSGSSDLLPAPGVAGLHPAACRARPEPLAPPCGHRLDAGEAPALAGEHLVLQRRLERLLLDEPTAGAGPSPAQYFNDLRILSCLICASWPAAARSCDNATRQLIGQHVTAVRLAIDAVRAKGKVVRELEHYDRPPLDPLTGAALLHLADTLAQADDRERSGVLRDMLNAMPAASRTKMWLRQFRRGDYGSTTLGDALVAIMFPPPVPSPPPRLASFAADHIPHHLPDHWFGRHLAHLTGMREAFIHRAAALYLAQIVVGGSWQHAAKPIEMPASTAMAAAQEFRGLSAGNRVALKQALEELAAAVQKLPTMTNYGHRRRSLRGWAISIAEWDKLTIDLQAADTHRNNPDRPTDWADHKRLSASAWVWATVTGSEERFAPAFDSSPHRSTPNTLVGVTSNPRFNLARRDYGHYAALRTRLTAYAETLADHIDRSA